jgi:hypothetical protein
MKRSYIDPFRELLIVFACRDRVMLTVSTWRFLLRDHWCTARNGLVEKIVSPFISEEDREQEEEQEIWRAFDAKLYVHIVL